MDLWTVKSENQKAPVKTHFKKDLIALPTMLKLISMGDTEITGTRNRGWVDGMGLGKSVKILSVWLLLSMLLATVVLFKIGSTGPKESYAEGHVANFLLRLYSLLRESPMEAEMPDKEAMFDRLHTELTSTVKATTSDHPSVQMLAALKPTFQQSLSVAKHRFELHKKIVDTYENDLIEPLIQELIKVSKKHGSSAVTVGEEKSDLWFTFDLDDENPEKFKEQYLINNMISYVNEAYTTFLCNDVAIRSVPFLERFLKRSDTIRIKYVTYDLTWLDQATSKIRSLIDLTGTYETARTNAVTAQETLNGNFEKVCAVLLPGKIATLPKNHHFGWAKILFLLAFLGSFPLVYFPRKAVEQLSLLRQHMARIGADPCSLPILKESLPHYSGEVLELANNIVQYGERIESNLTLKDESMEHLKGGIEDLSQITHHTVTSMKETQELTDSVLNGSERLSLNLNTMVTHSEEISSASRHISSTISEVRTSMRKMAEECKNEAEIVFKANQETETTRKVMDELGRASNEMGKIVEIINSLTAQTHLLALNATIEAASAGEAGKGFAVVANEIKELVRKSSDSIRQVVIQIGNIQKKTKESVRSIEAISGLIGKGHQIATSVTDMVESQSTFINEMATSLEQISASTNSLAFGTQTSANNAQKELDNIRKMGKISREILESLSRLRQKLSEFNLLATQ
jgi:methyl-accepting chemotaxis protein